MSFDSLKVLFEGIKHPVEDPVVLTKCLTFLSRFQLTERELMDYWEAFSLSNDKVKPTSTSVIKFEHYLNENVNKNNKGKQLPNSPTNNNKRKNPAGSPSTKSFFGTTVKSPVKLPQTPTQPTTQPTTQYQSQDSTQNTQDDIKLNIDSQTPDNSPYKKIKPTATDVYLTQRGSSGQVLIDDKKELPLIQTNTNVLNIDISEPTNAQPCKYMWTKPENQLTALDARIENIGKKLLERHILGDSQQFHIADQSPVVAVGIIGFEGNALNLNSCTLTSSRGFTREQERVKLDLIELKSLELFPGQVVAVKGVNLYGKRLVAKEMFVDASIPFRTPLSGIPCLKVLIACGPFCTDQESAYQPFHDLLTKIIENSPDVVIMIGPFVDILTSNSIPETESFSEMFNNLVTYMKKLTCKIVLVPSLRDAHHSLEFPQPPFVPFEETMIRNKFNNEFPNVICASNPCTIRINDISFGICGNDVLKHLQANVLSKNEVAEEKEVSQVRFIRHTIQQQSYYPLYPGQISRTDDGAYNQHIDLEQADKVNMPYTPDVLIYPSQFPAFVYRVESVLCVNPSRIINQKRYPGSFALLHIQPLEEINLLETVSERTRVQVIRI